MNKYDKLVNEESDEITKKIEDLIKRIQDEIIKTSDITTFDEKVINAAIDISVKTTAIEIFTMMDLIFTNANIKVKEIIKKFDI